MNVSNPRNTSRPSRRPDAGFTLVEMMVTLVVFALVVATVAAIVVNVGRNRDKTAYRSETTQAARAAMDLIARDLRSAGYGVDMDAATPQPAIAYVDSAEIILCQNQQPFPDTLSVGPQVPQAYQPTGNPRPATLNGTAWQPPQKYATGAELIRWTLDVNNDGGVDASDLSATQGFDAARTENPDDFVLVREVYGDMTGGVAGNNGGAQERVALVRKPGGGVPAIFTVYMKGSTTPWNWANGPVPAAQLDEIQRVEVRVTAAAPRKDADGRFAQTTLATQVNSMRSVPDFGISTYTVSGYVFDDLNQNGVMDGSDAGLAGVTVRLGNYIGYTSATGYYAIQAANGTYTLRHNPPSGYGTFTNPDTFLVTVASAPVTRSFADTARQGGWVTMRAFGDEDGDGSQDGDEPVLSGIRFTMNPGGAEVYTDAYGTARLFAQTGGFTCSATVPDSMRATTASSLSGTMTNGGSDGATVGLQVSDNGTLRGQVFRDNNRNGVPDGTDAGLSNVWVGATTDGGLTIQGYVYTDASGNFSITVPANDPPRTQPYTLFIVPPAGFFPTNSTMIPNVYVQANQTVSGHNFGMASYQIITLNASRVLSLASRDLIEKDWNGNQTQNARRDADLVLGADAGGTDNVSVWFNNYAATPLFNPSATYSRLAPNSVMAMAVDTLDKSAPVARPDLVTGTKSSVSGNFFVWLNQGSNNNEGYFPTSYSTGMNYRTYDGGDVQAVLTADVAGGAMPDILVGTKSPVADRGTVEIWQSSDATTPTFSRIEIYPSIGGIPGAKLGEVTAMAMADFDGDGVRDLVLGTRTSEFTGQVVFLQGLGKLTTPKFLWRNSVDISSGYVTALGVVDVDLDGQRDVVIGTRLTSALGKIIWLRNRNSYMSWGFENRREVDAPGVVMSLSVADMGGGSTSDLIVGWRSSENAYGGGVTVYYLDMLTLPSAGVDPSNGAILNMVPASTVANFNYGLNTTTPPVPYLSDFAVGVKASATTGAVVIFIR